MNNIIKNKLHQVKESLNILSLLKKLYFFYDYFLVAHITKNQPKQSLKSTCILTLVVVLISFYLNWGLLKSRSFPLVSDGHSLASFNIAVTRVVCGEVSSVNRNLTQFIVNQNIQIVDTKILDLPKLSESSESEYCQMASPFLNNENSLGWLMEIILRLSPNVTINQLGVALNSIRTGCLITFTFFLIWIGISPFISFLALNIGISVVGLINETHYYSVYPFLMPFTVFLIALLGIAIKLKTYQRVYVALPVLIGIGIYGALFKNIRTSYYPVILVSVLGYIIFTLCELKGNRQFSRTYKRVFPGLAIIAFYLGIAIFNTNLLQPIENLDIDHNRSYHVIAHPLVLSLALPESELSQREGIKWNDGVGTSLANRIDPDVTYLDANYEKALFTYYFKLWIYHPNEMVNIYWQKLKLAGSQIPGFITKSDGINKLLLINSFPLKFLSNGTITISIFSLISLLGFFLQRYCTPEFLFALTGIFGAGVLLLIESAIIMPFFVATYHSYLVFGFLCFTLALYQLLFNLLALFSQRIFKLIPTSSEVNQ